MHKEIDINKFKFQKVPNSILSSYHLFVVLVPNKRDELFKKLRKKNFFVQLHYIPIYRHSYYKKKYNYKFSNFPNTEIYFKRALSIPNYPGLEIKKINFMQGPAQKTLILDQEYWPRLYPLKREKLKIYSSHF